MRVLVVGAGIGGLSAATALRQHGHDVDIIEAKPDSSVYGVGINQPANSLRALRSIGVLHEVIAAGYTWDTAKFYDPQGDLIADRQSAFGSDVPANIALSRSDLQRILISAAERQQVKVAYSTTMVSFTDKGDAVDVELTGGIRGTYGLVAAFDGIRSQTRRTLFGPEHDAIYSGFSVFRITLPRPQYLTGIHVYQAIGVKAGFIPLSQESMYMFVVTPESENLVKQRDQFPKILRERMAPFGALPGEVRDGISDDDDIVLSPISDVLLPPSWFCGRVGILGDAAHACAPHLTQGAGMAIEDAVVLAECLDAPGTLADNLRLFDDRRYPRAKFVQDVSHQILDSEMLITSDNWDET